MRYRLFSSERTSVLRLQGMFLRRVLILLALVCSLIILSFAMVSHADSPASETGYQSIRIEYGDTLSRIAAEHMSEAGLSFDDMMFEIKRLNRLSTDLIYAGSYLIIPCLLQ